VCRGDVLAQRLQQRPAAEERQLRMPPLLSRLVLLRLAQGTEAPRDTFMH
jgi:hypothetical protein